MGGKKVLQKDDSTLIIGAGIIGLSIGISLLESNPKKKVFIYEKEDSLGAHASGRNSGVIHAGFYYSPDSLKAQFCVDGNKELRKMCRLAGLPINEVGKVVVSKNNEEDIRLQELYRRGIKNGVELELLDGKFLSRIEPAARTNEQFLFSPNTAIASPSHVLEFMHEEFLRLGGTLIRSKNVTLSLYGDEVKAVIDGKIVSQGMVVNAAGTGALNLAKSVGVGQEYINVPFKGVYRVSTGDVPALKRLIYPVPHPINPFLGAHLTLTLDGQIKIGPTALPVLGGERYDLTSKLRVTEVLESVKGMYAIATGREHNLFEILKEDFPKNYRRNLINEVASLVPTIKTINKWQKMPPGIRAQVVNANSGKLEQDFIVKMDKNVVHILNAVSPGWTCSIPFARWVVNEKLH